MFTRGPARVQTTCFTFVTKFNVDSVLSVCPEKTKWRQKWYEFCSIFVSILCKWITIRIPVKFMETRTWAFCKVARKILPGRSYTICACTTRQWFVTKSVSPSESSPTGLSTCSPWRPVWPMTINYGKVKFLNIRSAFLASRKLVLSKLLVVIEPFI